tara:strand:+ start:1629 stop:1877 length:249 start_codon:yes stop_codon:yes gene_type:complete
MNKKQIEKIVVDYFKKRNPEKKSFDLDEDIFAQGYVDSLGTLDMICKFEEKFNIKFETEDMENIDFKIISGLVNIIYQKTQE